MTRKRFDWSIPRPFSTAGTGLAEILRALSYVNATTVISQDRRRTSRSVRADRITP